MVTSYLQRDKMMTIGIGLFFTLCHITNGFDNHIGKNDESKEYRILLLGKTGHGKSSLGNHLLGREAFESSPSPNSVTTTGQKVTGKIGDTPIIVVDTPGVSDTVLDQTQTISLIAEAVAFSPQGYDGFLVVMNPTVRITPEEKHAIKLLHELFGDRFFDYVIFVFTHKNGFEEGAKDKIPKYTFHKYLSEVDDDMKTFLSKARRRYVFMDAKERNNHQRKLTNMKFLEHLESIREAEGERYSNSIFNKVAVVKLDYDNGRHQRFRSNEIKTGGKAFFRYMYETARKLICAVLFFTPFAC